MLFDFGKKQFKTKLKYITSENNYLRQAVSVLNFNPDLMTL